MGTAMKVVELVGTERKPEWFDPVSEDWQLDRRYEELLEEEQGNQYEAARRLIEEVSPRKGGSIGELAEELRELVK